MRGSVLRHTRIDWIRLILRGTWLEVNCDMDTAFNREEPNITY